MEKAQVEDHSKSRVPRPRKLDSAQWRYGRKGEGEDPGQIPGNKARVCRSGAKLWDMEAHW